MRIHPPDLAALFSLQWEMGNIFPGDVLLLSIRKIVFAPPGGSSDGEMSPSVQPHLSPSECFSSLSLLRLPFFPYLFVSLYLALTFPLHLLHSLSWHLLSGSLIILFFRFLIRILSLRLPLFFFLLPSPTISSVQWCVLSYILSRFLFFLSASSIQHNLIQSLSHYPCLHYTSHLNFVLSLCFQRSAFHFPFFCLSLHFFSISP